ncbi:MAG: GntR family transcriptional regulator [Acidobacteriia bacterium]|nr:GntR family transcriptional regulator [Terriglobia bacterium]
MLTIRKFAAPLRRQVLEELRQSIIAGRLAPGSRLVERELISMTGVSRTVIREALRQLESEGLITIIPNKGPVVRELTLGEAKDLYSIRAVLEGLAARLFAENAADAQIAELEAALNGTEEAYRGGDAERILKSKNRFYDVLFEGAGSETLSSMIGMLHVRIWRWRALGLGHPNRSEDRWKESIRGLRAMLDAMKKRDATLAEKTTREEVTRAAAEVMRLVGGSGEVQ